MTTIYKTHTEYLNLPKLISYAMHATYIISQVRYTLKIKATL